MDDQTFFLVKEENETDPLLNRGKKLSYST